MPLCELVSVDATDSVRDRGGRTLDLQLGGRRGCRPAPPSREAFTDPEAEDASPGWARGTRGAVPIALPVLVALAAALWWTPQVPAQEFAIPIPDEERLVYSIAWPSGLSVGRAEFRARNLDPGWRFELTMSASLPSIEIDDAFRSRTDSATCSIEFEKHARHGERRAHESLRFRSGSLERINLEADAAPGSGIVPTEECARDALAFLYFLRADLAAGRVPPASRVYFGAGYRLELELEETRRLVWDGERRLVDEIRAVIRGPASEHELSAFFDRDEARTPLIYRMEFDGTPFTMQLNLDE